MRWYRGATAIAFTICSSCAAMRASPSTVVPSAEIGAEFARFVFPREPDSTFSWHAPAPGTYLGDPEYFWNISWEVDEPYTDPELISVIVRWDSTGMRHGTLSELVRVARIEVGTPCIACEPPGFFIATDAVLQPPSIVVAANRGAVVVSVRGRATIARLFPHVPDSVSMSISRLDGSDDEMVLPVRKRR